MLRLLIAKTKSKKTKNDIQERFKWGCPQNYWIFNPYPKRNPIKRLWATIYIPFLQSYPAKIFKRLNSNWFSTVFVSFLLFQFCKGIHKFLSWKTEYFFGISWNTLRFYLVPFQNTCFKYFQVKFFLFSFLFLFNVNSNSNIFLSDSIIQIGFFSSLFCIYFF